MTKTLSEIQLFYLDKISDYLRSFSDSLYTDNYQDLQNIFYYHLGLHDPLNKQGKRIRPILTLICATGAGIPYEKAMPAAGAIELIHNFSLIHDDIEDNGTVRRGKQAVWRKWGLAQGLNAGDAMFNAAFIALQGIAKNFSPDTYFSASELFADTCSSLTKGQFLDIGFEEQEIVSIDAYLEMVNGKTAALLACSTQMGALLAEKETKQLENYRAFGQSLGVAFQIYDDWLGVWGEEDKTGKSTSSDILEKKKSLPILIGIEKSERFKGKFQKTKLSAKDANLLAMWLREDGIEDQVKELFSKWSQRAFNYLDKMECRSVEKKYLRDITNKLLMRDR